MSDLHHPLFSRRTAWEQAPNPLTEAWRGRLESGLSTVDLTESNPTRCGFRYPEDRILRALADPRGLRYEPDPRGLPSAREAIARRMGCDAEDLILAAGTSEAYGWLFKLLCEPGDRVLIPRPGYPLFDFLADLEEIGLDHYPLRYEARWRVDFDALEAAITPQTRAIIVVHPNNPTGSALTREEAARLTRICAARGLAVISDEVFLAYPFEVGDGGIATPGGMIPATESRGPAAAVLPLAGSLAEDSPCLAFSLGGLSKTAALPQVKVAWIRVGGPGAVAGQARARLEVIADTYLSVNTPAQWALPSLLEAGDAVREQILRRTRGNRRWLAAQAQPAAAWDLLAADGGWSAVLRVPRLRSEEEWCLLLVREEGVLLHPGYFFEFEREAFLVVSLLPREQAFAEAMERVLGHMG